MPQFTVVSLWNAVASGASHNNIQIAIFVTILVVARPLQPIIQPIVGFCKTWTAVTWHPVHCVCCPIAVRIFRNTDFIIEYDDKLVIADLLVWMAQRYVSDAFLWCRASAFAVPPVAIIIDDTNFHCLGAPQPSTSYVPDQAFIAGTVVLLSNPFFVCSLTHGSGSALSSYVV